MRALTWHTPARSVIPTKANPAGVLPAVRISTYHDTYGPVQPPEFRHFLEVQRLSGDPMPPLMFDSVRCFPFRHQVSDIDAFRRSASAARDYDEKLSELTAAGLPAGESEAEYTHGETLDDTDGLLSVKLLHAIWRLCEQRITVLNQAPINHSARITSERARVSPQVRIMRLRRASTPGDSAPEQSARNWNHRWIVRMHKVRQWYPSLDQHKILYRGPYIKGPDGKPLLSGETVRALVR